MATGIQSHELQGSPALDVWSADDSQRGPCTGYLDLVLRVFKDHHQPFLLVGPLAARWHGCEDPWRNDISVLIEQTKLESICASLVATREWSRCPNPFKRDDLLDPRENTTAIPETWLISHNTWTETIDFFYLLLWPEELYKLSINCNKYEVPDITTTQAIIFEEEFREHAEESGSSHLPPVSRRCKWSRRDLSIFVPTIADHLYALLEQALDERRQKTQCGNEPNHQIGRYIEHLKWDQTAKGEWLLAEKISPRHHERMKSLLDNYARVPVRRRYDTAQTQRNRNDGDQLSDLNSTSSLRCQAETGTSLMQQTRELAISYSNSSRHQLSNLRRRSESPDSSDATSRRERLQKSINAMNERVKASCRNRRRRDPLFIYPERRH